RVMADDQSTKKSRRLRQAPQTMRQRAEQSVAPKKPSRWRFLARLNFIRRGIDRVRRLRIWAPFKFIGRLVVRFLIPPYFRRSFQELRQVTWPTRKQSRQLTTAVILFSLVFGILVAIFDYGLDRLFKVIITK